MKYSEDFVRGLSAAENNFLQLLVTRFSLTGSGRGFELAIRFDDHTPAIWSRHAKTYVRDLIPQFNKKRALYQKQLDSRLHDGNVESLHFDDQMFPFRYASGGVLPILRMGSKEYFSFFYRDIDPIGWNIANGASDSRAEFLYPQAAIEREFREELILIKPPQRSKPNSGRRYVFNWGGSVVEDHVEHAMARRLWTATFPGLDVENFEQLPLPVEWLTGPDAVTVKMGKSAPVRTEGVFLNVNAIDFGIEVDKMARIYVDEDVVLLDGEIMDQKVLGRPVGRFEVDRLVKGFHKEAKFLPDKFFYKGRSCDGSTFERVIGEEFTPSLKEVRTPKERTHFRKLKERYDLCPVTRSIVGRYARLSALQEDRQRPAKTLTHRKVARRSGRFEVFISCGAGDEPIAERVYDYVTDIKKKPTFFYKKFTATRWGRQIADALDSADCLVLVGSDYRRISRGWPETEWFAFLNAVNTGRKGPGSKLIPFLTGVELSRVPIFLSGHVAINTGDIKEGLKKLGELLDS